MKNLPCIILAAAPAGLVALAAVSSFGVNLPVQNIAAHYVAASAGAGVLAMFCHDYAPRSRPRPKAAKAPAPAPRRTAPAVSRAPADVLVTLGLRNDPATVSLM